MARYQDFFTFIVSPIRDDFEVPATHRGLRLFRHCRELTSVISNVGDLVHPPRYGLDNLRDVATFVSEKLATIPGVLSTATHFMLKPYKEQGVLMSYQANEERLAVSP